MTTTKIPLQEDNILKLVLEFLSSRKFYKAARVLEKETTVANCPYSNSESIAFIRELVLDGEWEALAEYTQPFTEIHDFDYQKFCFLVTRQKYLEILFEKCEGSVKDEHIFRDRLVSCLQLLEQYCSRKDEYNKLYWYLSVPSLREEPEFLGWSVEFSRTVLFDEVLALLKPFVPLEEHNSSKNVVSGDRLLDLISKGLLYENCIRFCQKQATHQTNNSDFSHRDIRTDIFRVQSPESTGNFYSWLHSLSPEDFLIPFEELGITFFVEKTKPSLSRVDMKNNLLTKSLTLEPNAGRNQPYNKHKHVRIEEERHPAGYQRTRYSNQVEFNGRDVSQSWADFNISPRNDKRTDVTNTVTQDHVDMVAQPKKNAITKSHDGYHGTNLPAKVSTDDHAHMGMLPKKTIANYGHHLDDKSPARVTENVHAGIKWQSGKTVPNNHGDFNDNKDMVTHNDHTPVVRSPRKTKETQQELVLKKLEEHKRKQQELHQQLAEMTATLPNKDNRDNSKEGEWPDNINGIIPGDITTRKSLEALRKSKESLSFLNKTSVSPRASTTTTDPISTRPQRISISGTSQIANGRPKSTSGSEPKTPVNQCLPPGLVKLADGSGTFGTSTPKSQKQNFMTPPPPASPVTLEQKATMGEMPQRHSQQKKVVSQEPQQKREMDAYNQTPRRTNVGTKQSVVRTLANDISEKRQTSVAPVMPDETFAVKKKDPVNSAMQIKFQKVAVLADTQAIRSVAFHPSGNYFAVGTNSKSLKVCSFQNLDVNPYIRSDHDTPRQPEVIFKKTPIHKGSVYCIAFSPRGNIIATGSNDKLIKLLRFSGDGVESLQDEMELAIHSATVRDLVFVNSATSPPILASGGAGGGLVYLSDCITGQTISSLQGHSGNIMTLFAGSHENLLCSGSADKSVRVWDLRSQQCIDVIPSSSCVASVCFNYGNGPIHLASAHENGQCFIYDISTRKTLSTFQPHTMDCRTIRYSPDSKYLLTGSYDASIVVTAVEHDLNSETSVHSHTVARHRDKVIQCRWHPSVYSFLSSSADKTVALWELEGR